MTHDAAPELAAADLGDGRRLAVRPLTPQDADLAVGVIHRAFRARPVIGAAAAALLDDATTIGDALARGGGYLAVLDGGPVGIALVTRREDGSLRIGRVGVVPDHRQQGIASFLITVILDLLSARGESSVHLLARKEYPAITSWWQRHGFVREGEEGDCWVLIRALPVAVPVPDAEAMRALGRRLARLLGPGDVIIASGDLGAGKTTLTQGIGAGLGVAGAVISPTFVLARVHPSLGGGPPLIHVDAYRLGSFAELEDLDLEATLADSVTLIEWGSGVAEPLAPSRLEIDIRRGLDPTDETRWVFLTPIGRRFNRAALALTAKEER
ncbi:MAG: tRNA (adenosine(37)-N6)-threonylcarbamoyltransferase complex ATPase subunit type 1 TsaE [Propioniciclava sp.]